MAKIRKTIDIKGVTYTPEELQKVHWLIRAKGKKKLLDLSLDEYEEEIDKHNWEIRWCGGDEKEAFKRWDDAHNQAVIEITHYFENKYGHRPKKENEEEMRELWSKVFWREFTQPILDFIDEYYQNPTAYH